MTSAATSNTVMRITTISLIVLLAACSSGTTDTSQTTTTTTSTTSTSTSTTTTTLPTTTTTTPAPELPSTWVGVTADYEAVEVDTATGEVVRSIAQVSTAEDVETAECAACVNAVDAVWRSADGSLFFVSECCEPAAGMIHVLTPDDLPYMPGDDAPTWSVWSAAPAPDGAVVAFLGYEAVVTSTPQIDRGAPGADVTVAWTSDGSLPISNAVWDAGEVVWLHGGNDSVELWTFDVATGSITEVDVPELAGWTSATLARRSPGELVAVRSPFDEPASEAVVVDPSGSVIDRFALETGARLGGYDATGTLLIYTDGDGVVRWRADDDAGVLGEGFVHAGW